MSNPLSLGRKAKPTLKHRPAVWEAMLGTVYAMNDEGEIRYFDYKWDEAVAFARITPERDPRVATPKVAGRRGTNHPDKAPRMTQQVLWVTK